MEDNNIIYESSCSTLKSELLNSIIVCSYDHCYISTYLIKINCNTLNFKDLFEQACLFNKLNLVKYIIENYLIELRNDCIKYNTTQLGLDTTTLFNLFYSFVLIKKDNRDITLYLLEQIKLELDENYFLIYLNEIFMNNIRSIHSYSLKFNILLLKNYAIDINNDLFKICLQFNRFDLFNYILKLRKLQNKLDEETKIILISQIIDIYYQSSQSTHLLFDYKLFKISNYIISNTDNLDTLQSYKKYCVDNTTSCILRPVDATNNLPLNNILFNKYYKLIERKIKIIEFKFKHARKKIVYFFYNYVAPVIYHPKGRIAQNTINKLINNYNIIINLIINLIVNIIFNNILLFYCNNRMNIFSFIKHCNFINCS